MTKSELKGMFKLHKKFYEAYKSYGQIEKAKQARKKMLFSYLQLRELRKE